MNRLQEERSWQTPKGRCSFRLNRNICLSELFFALLQASLEKVGISKLFVLFAWLDCLNQTPKHTLLLGE